MSSNPVHVAPTRSDHRTPEASTVGLYLTEWLQGRQALRPSTRRAYEGHIRRYLVPHLGRLHLPDLSITNIEQAYREIVGDDSVSPATLRRIHATLMSALNMAVRRGTLDRNPAAYVELPRVPRRRMNVWSAEQLATFFDTTKHDRLSALFLLVGLTGMRRGEALGLRWIDVDLAGGWLHIEQQIVAVGGETHVGPPKSGNGRRAIALPDRLAAALTEHETRQHVERDAAGVRWVDTGLVFTTELGTALRPGQVSRHFDRLATAAGLPPIRFHDLRHSSASLGLASGESLLEVSRRLGHSSITITADVYSHIAPATARRAADRLDELISNCATPTSGSIRRR